AGKSIYAHEFHYTCAISETGDPLFSVCDALGSSLGNHGLRDGNVMGSYMHLISAREHQDG
ncbi:MAG: cobyrinic acid a,c-diamide synthase, partial [Chloroflexi bacterium]|nr:cobyrinic acid a,c-diamide synthase [Chloroflexota bacterium]